MARNKKTKETEEDFIKEADRDIDRRVVEKKLKGRMQDLSKQEITGLAEKISACEDQKELTDILSQVGFRRIGDLTEADVDQNIAESTKERVFGIKDPTIAGLRGYIRRIMNGEGTLYHEKQKIVKTVNFWKRKLNAVFTFEGQACSIKARSTGGRAGAYQLRALGGNRKSIFNSVEFPEILVSRKKNKGKGQTT